MAVIDYRNRFHKNDSVGSQVSESINYRADLNISSSPSASPPTPPSLKEEHVIDVSLIYFAAETRPPLICMRALPLREAYLFLNRKANVVT